MKKSKCKCEYKDYCEEAMEEQERFNELSRYDRKLEKIYEAILDVQDRIDAQIRYQRKEELKMQQARIEDEKISIKMMDCDYSKRKLKLDYFNERY